MRRYSSGFCTSCCRATRSGRVNRTENEVVSPSWILKCLGGLPLSIVVFSSLDIALFRVQRARFPCLVS